MYTFYVKIKFLIPSLYPIVASSYENDTSQNISSYMMKYINNYNTMNASEVPKALQLLDDVDKQNISEGFMKLINKTVQLHTYGEQLANKDKQGNNFIHNILNLANIERTMRNLKNAQNDSSELLLYLSSLVNQFTADNAALLLKSIGNEELDALNSNLNISQQCKEDVQLLARDLFRRETYAMRC